jgi:uncharacterized protein (DUF2062 family)
MLFRRRKPSDLWDRLRTFAWPRRSFSRSAQYFAKRVLRLTATPHAIAAGVAAGAFASFTPYMGFHFFLAALLAWVMRGNLVASALGTAVGNPITFPFIWAGCLALGRKILYGAHPEQLVPLQLGKVLWEGELEHLWKPLLLPMTVGGVILGTICGLVLYALTWWAVAGFREQRRQRLVERARVKARMVAAQVAAR